MKPSRDYDESLLKALADPDEAAAFLSAALEEDDPALFLRALGQVARARGMTETAERAGMNRVSLYKALSETGNPELRSVVGVLHAIGLKLEVGVERP
jgi:probable addiction module antidote protein